MEMKKCFFKNAFVRAAKRKVEEEVQSSLFSSMSGLVLSRKKMVDINLSFKKLKLSDDDVSKNASDDSDGLSDDVSDGSNDTCSSLGKGVTTKPNCSSAVEADLVVENNDVKKQEAANVPLSAVLFSRGNGEAMTSDVQCSYEFQRC